MKKFWADFKKFISRGNVIDMAIGVIIGSAFNTIVKTFTDKIIMPFINLLLSLGGDKGLETAYTVLKPVFAEDGSLDLTKSIYIDWGSFITAILNFLIIAMTLFIIIKVANKSREVMDKTRAKVSEGKATAEEKKVLKERGVSTKDRQAYREALMAYRKELAESKAEEEANKPIIETDIDVLRDIRELLKANQAQTETKNEDK